VVAVAAQVSSLAGTSTAGFTGGAGASAQFNAPYGTAADAQGNVYVADYNNHAIRKVSAGGVVSTLAGTGTAGYADGIGTSAQFSHPAGVALQRNGTIIVADVSNNRIRQVTAAGDVSTVGGNGTAGYADGWQGDAQFSAPSAVAVDAAGNIYVADAGNNRIRKISPFGLVTTIAGSGAAGYADGVGVAAQFNAPAGVAVDGYGNVFVSDQMNQRIRKIAPDGTVTTVAGNGVAGFADGVGTGAQFSRPTLIAVGVNGVLYVADQDNNRIRSVQENGTVSTVAGGGAAAATTMKNIDLGGNQASVKKQSSELAVSAQAQGDIKQAKKGNGSSEAIGKPNDTPTTHSGGYADGKGDQAEFNGPTGVAVDANGNIYVADFGNNRIRKISPFSPVSVVAPVITGFTPASGTIGSTITIRGTDFTGATTVSFGGTSAVNFTVVSDSVITATVGNGASGSASVTTPNGTGTLAGFTYTPLTSPVISSFAPTSARPGDTVIIRGVRFFTASTVSFGGVAVRYTVVSDSVIHAYISTSVVSGAVNVVNAAGNSTLNGFTFIPLPPAPRITSFTPNRAAEGASVVITGTSLTGATRVKFGAFDAASFMVNSATQITAVVGAGSSGAVSVQTAGGTFSLNGFTFVPPAATLSGFMPTSAAIGTTVVITGTNLSSALAVEFGGRSAVFTVNSNSQITATVPAGALSGTVSVTTLAGAASLSGFTFLAPPVVSGFTPTSAGVGASVVIAGSNFSGADTVRIGGVVASFVVNSASQITATVPAGAASGSVSVRTPYGTGSLAGFVFIPSPAITSFSPAVAGAGDVVTINGTNFTDASAVSFGGVPAASFTVVSATRITAAPSASGASGDISVTTPNGTGTRSGFSFAGVPVITAFSPTGATGGDTVTITGTNFVGVSTLTFGNTAVTSFTIVSPTQIKAVVSPRGSTGAVRLVTPGGTASLNGFTFTAPAPVITGFTPASATVEQTVTITGRNFAGDLYSTLAVSFGGRAAGRFTVVNDSTITAAVGGGATGSVSVRTPGGTANRAGFTFIPAAPVITGFTPASAPAGATITISGNNFFAASAVHFGGIAGTSLVVVNDSTVTVRVAASGASGVVTLTTPSGTATSASAFTFIPAPVISAFAPASASVGDTVSIAGTGFTGATAVRFGGTAALPFTVVSDTEIQAVVNGGSTGAVTVVSPNGTGTLSGFTYLPPAPRITSFTPATAAAGTSVVINGNYFTGATAVNFGGVAATSFVINSATRITAVVAAGSASGDITVTSPNGTGTRSGFTFLAAPPAIASFSPTSAPAGGTVLIRGTGFTGATAVRFGGSAAASFTRTGDTLISARVSASGASGDISVVSVAGTGTLSGFVFIPAPSISSFSPTSAAQGDTVTIAGANFLGATAVSFGGAAANIVSVNATQIVVLVGSGASGSLSLTTPGGSASKTGFTYLPPGPRITGFTPATATPGTSVVISGSSFTGATAVSFGGIAAQSFVVNSATRITAVVPATALSGNVSVTTPLGTASMAGFTFTPVPAPVITSFTPTTMPSGSTTTTMTINGRNFTGATAVSVGGVAVPFTVVSATRITARLTGAFGGAVSVTTPGGTATMAGFVLTSLFDMKSDNLTSANGNGSNSNAEELNVVTGVSNLDAPPLTAFPNPASESVTLTGSGFAEGRLVSLTLVNALGQTVMTLTQQPIGGILQANVDVRHVPSGAYTAVLSDSVLQRAVRFVKR
ncbi:MAG: IPT/TIG domain-containing protein, partial [Candidatus Kapabacteria bacterium]|nr:IPT/TIG domain-containing protein [Candidatus Kapabacteria bacterium]